MSPERSCIVCRRKCPKGQLVRLVVSEGGTIEIDHAARAPGRGRYVCPEKACIEGAFKERRRKRDPALGRLTREEAESLVRRLIERTSKP